MDHIDIIRAHFEIRPATETRFPDANVMLMAIIKADGDAETMFAAIVAESKKNERRVRTIESTDNVFDIYLSDRPGRQDSWYALLMATDYNAEYDISADAGNIVLFDFMTMGATEKQSWSYVEEQKNKLEAWAKGVCERHGGEFDIVLTANYWG